MNILLIDNRDSFAFNLAEACRDKGAVVRVVRNSVAAGEAIDFALKHDATLMLSPGPGGPADAGCCMDLIRLAAGRLPLIGICLGHQAIVASAGGEVRRAARPSHGKCSAIEHDGRSIFEGLASPLTVARYHSLCTPVDGVPGRFRIEAQIDGMAMAITDEAAGQIGLQFHPESILTPRGDRLIENLLAMAGAMKSRMEDRELSQAG